MNGIFIWLMLLYTKEFLNKNYNIKLKCCKMSSIKKDFSKINNVFRKLVCVNSIKKSQFIGCIFDTLLKTA